MSSDRAALRAAAPAPGAPGRAATPASHARAEASRKNGARSRGPKTSAGKARSAQNALKHGLRALGYVVLPDESALEFQALEAALLDELAPVGALQRLLATRVAIAAWRLSRADRIETELFAERRWTPGDPLGLAMIRDGNGTRSFETLMRYRSAALAEFWRALKTLKALQAEAKSVEQPAASAPAPHASTRGSPRPLAAAAPNEPERRAARSAPPPPAQMAHRPTADRAAARRNTNEPRPPVQPNEPERRAAAGPERLEFLVHDRPNEPERRSVSVPEGLEFLLPDRPAPGALHEPAAAWTPNEPENLRPGDDGAMAHAVRGASGGSSSR